MGPKNIFSKFITSAHTHTHTQIGGFGHHKTSPPSDTINTIH